MTTTAHASRLLTIAQDHLNGPTRSHMLLQSELAKSLHASDLNKAISLLTELKDFENGIYWQIIPKPDPLTNDVLIRDARKVHDNPSNRHYGFAIQSLNYLRAANCLLQIKANQEKTEPLTINLAIGQLIEKYEKAYKSGGYDELLKIVAQFNQNLNQTLAKSLSITEQQCATQLKKAKDFMNFEDESRHVVTVDTHPDSDNQYIMQAEYICTKLTSDQIKEYQNKNLKSWYTTLPSWQKALVDRYQPTILQQQHVIPTQLRDCVVGARNFNMKITGLGGQDRAPIICDMSFHSGTITNQGKKCPSEENLRLAQLNAQQYQEATKSPLHMLTLNAQWNPQGPDKVIVENSAKVMSSSNNQHSNLCFNSFRLISPNKYTGVQQKLNTLTDILLSYPLSDREKKFIDHYLKKSPNFPWQANKHHRQAKKLAETIKNKLHPADIYQALIQAIECRHAMNLNFLPYDPDNRNLKIATFSHLLDNMLREYLKGSPSHHETISACQSGKDRNGILMHELSTCAIASQNYFSNNSILTLSEKLSKSNHVGFMAGVQGGTLGCFGIKKDSKAALPSYYSKQTKDNLLQPEAAFNNRFYGVKPADNKSLINKIKTKWRSWLPKSTNDSHSYKTLIEIKASSLTHKKDSKLTKPVKDLIKFQKNFHDVHQYSKKDLKIFRDKARQHAKKMKVIKQVKMHKKFAKISEKFESFAYQKYSSQSTKKIKDLLLSLNQYVVHPDDYLTQELHQVLQNATELRDALKDVQRTTLAQQCATIVDTLSTELEKRQTLELETDHANRPSL